VFCQQKNKTLFPQTDIFYEFNINIYIINMQENEAKEENKKTKDQKQF
jgi:hypothetical protein